MSIWDVWVPIEGNRCAERPRSNSGVNSPNDSDGHDHISSHPVEGWNQIVGDDASACEKIPEGLDVEDAYKHQKNAAFD